MDPATLTALAEALVPAFGVLVCFGLPVALVLTVKHFKLRHRELDLEAELHGKQTQARLAAIEARLGTLEAAVGALVRGPATQLPDRRALLEAPTSASEEPTQLPAQSLRSR